MNFLANNMNLLPAGAVGSALVGSTDLDLGPGLAGILELEADLALVRGRHHADGFTDMEPGVLGELLGDDYGAALSAEERTHNIVNNPLDKFVVDESGIPLPPGPEQQATAQVTTVTTVQDGPTYQFDDTVGGYVASAHAPIIDDDDTPPPPPPPAAARRRTQTVGDKLAVRRVEGHITRMNKGLPPRKSGLDSGFDSRIKKLGKQKSNSLGANINTKGSHRATGSVVIRRMGELAADAEFIGMSVVATVTTPATGLRSGYVHSFGSGKGRSMLDLTLKEAIKMTSRNGRRRKNATSKLTIRALLEGVEAGLDFPDVAHRMQLQQDLDSDSDSGSDSE